MWAALSMITGSVKIAADPLCRHLFLTGREEVLALQIAWSLAAPPSSGRRAAAAAIEKVTDLTPNICGAARPPGSSRGPGESVKRPTRPPGRESARRASRAWGARGLHVIWRPRRGAPFLFTIP